MQQVTADTSTLREAGRGRAREDGEQVISDEQGISDYLRKRADGSARFAEPEKQFALVEQHVARIVKSRSS